MFDGLPKSYRLGPYTPQLTVVENLKHGDSDCLGLCKANTHNVLLSTTHETAQQAAVTLLHEIFHAMLNANPHHLKLKEEVEEQVVEVFSTWTAMLIRDNPELVQWLIMATKEKP